MQRIVILALFIVIFSFSLNAQQQTDSTKTNHLLFEKMHFGGSIQLSFGNSYTVVGVSPSVIYEISDKWAGGVSMSYIYLDDNLNNYTILGGSGLVLYNPIEEFQLHTEFENLRVRMHNSEMSDIYWVPAWYVGVGYSVGKHGSVGIRYDLLWDENKSIYNDALTPYVRFYF